MDIGHTVGVQVSFSYKPIEGRERLSGVALIICVPLVIICVPVQLKNVLLTNTGQHQIAIDMIVHSHDEDHH